MSKAARLKSGRSVNVADSNSPAVVPFTAFNLGGVMVRNLKILQDEGGAKLNTFDASLFFSILRAGGGNPLIRHGGLCFEIYPRSRIVREVQRWAALHDPSGDLRLEYARSVWKARKPGTEIINLG